MTVKKMSKILTFILVLAMVLGTVAMAEVGDSTGTPTATTTYTITAGAFTNGTITVKYSDGGKDYQLSITAGGTVTVKSGTKVTVSFNPKPGYEFVSATYKVGDTDAKPVADFGEIEITGNTAITPVFQAKSTLGGEKTADSFRLDAICSGSYYWQMYHKDMANNKKYTKYPGSPLDKVNPSSEIVKGNYVDLTLYVTDDDFLSLCGTTSYDKNNFSVTTPGDSSFLAGSGAGAEIEKWTVGSTDKGMVIQLTGVYYVGGSDNTLKLIITQGNYNAIVTCKIDNATIIPTKPDDEKPDTETTAAQPYVIISSYSYGKGDLVAGETRNITMTFRNTSKTMAVENMMVTMTLPDAMMLTSSSNSFYIESLAAEGTITKTALQVDRFTVTGIDLPQQIFIGEENNLSVNFVNKSRTDIYNLSAKLNCEGLSNNGEEQYLGNLASGTTSSADFYITGNEKCELVGEVIITYEDTNMNQRTVSVPFTTQVTSYEDVWGPSNPSVDPGMDPGTDPGMEEPAGFPWFWVIGGVVVVAAGVFVYLKLRKNKKESVDEDEDI